MQVLWRADCETKICGMEGLENLISVGVYEVRGWWYVWPLICARSVVTWNVVLNGCC